MAKEYTIKSYFEKALRILVVLGLNSNGKAIMNKIQKFILIPIMTIFYCLLLANLKYIEPTIFGISEFMEPVSTYGHAFYRKFCLKINCKQYELLLEDVTKLWDYDKFGNGSREILFRKRAQFCILLCKIDVFFMCSIGSIIILCILMPWLVGQEQLYKLFFLSEEHYYFNFFIKIIEIVGILEVLPSILNFDLVMFLLTIELQIQYQLLKVSLKNIVFGEHCTKAHELKCFEDFKEACLYHNLLLKIQTRMNNCTSEFFLGQFVLTVVGCTVQGLILTNDASSWQVNFKALVYMLAQLFQLAFFYFPITNMEIEIESLHDVIYDIDWYNCKNIKIRKQIIIMLMNTKEPLHATGKGLFIVDNEMFLKVLRLGFSICTLLKNLF